MPSIGYEIGQQAPEYQSDVKIGNDLSTETNFYKQQVAPQLISRLGSFLPTATQTVTSLATQFGKNAAKEGGKWFSKAGAGSAASVLGYVTGAASTLMNGLQAYSDTQAAKEKVDPGTIMDTSTRFTDTKFGQQYSVYGGADRDAIMDYIKQKNKLDRVNMGASYTTTGASFGGTVGGILGPVGAGIGTFLGGMIGATTGLSLAEKYNKEREEQAKRDITNANNAFYGFNTQSESVAGSKGLRQKHIYGLADEGKNVNQELGYPGKIGMVHTKNGIELGIQYGATGGGEIIIHPEERKVHVNDDGEKRVDNLPTGVPINSPNPNIEWGQTIILGNTTDKATGKKIADEARPYARAFEKNGDVRAFNKLMYFAGVQSNNLKNKNKDMYKADKDIYKADEGKLNWGELSSMIIPRMLQFGAISAANKKFTPTVTDPYAESNVSNQLKALYNLQHDPSQAIQNAKDAGRQATYAIRNSGGISSGQKAMMNAMNNHATAKSVNDVISAYNDKNIESQRAALGAALQAEESRAARRQQANLYTAEARAKAQEKPYAQQQAYLKSLHDMFGSFGLDVSQWFDNQENRKIALAAINRNNQDLTEKKPAKTVPTKNTYSSFIPQNLMQSSFYRNPFGVTLSSPSIVYNPFNRN